MTEPLPLTSLACDQSATVVRIDADALFAQRLLELGFVAGTPVRIVRRAPLGDPLELDVAGFRLSLRAEAAVHIVVGRDEPQ